MLAWLRHEWTLYPWSCFSNSCIMIWSKCVARRRKRMKRDFSIYLFIYLFGPNLSRRLSHGKALIVLLRIVKETCVRLCIFVCSFASTCVTLWEDERRQKGKRNAAVTSVLIIAQEIWHVCSRTLCCGAVKPQHNDPQLLVWRKLLSMGQNKVLSPYAYDSRGPPSMILAHQSLFHALQGGWIDI